MSTVAPPQPTTSSPVSVAFPALYRITVHEYEKIIAAAALDDASRIELIDGYLVEKMGKNAAHGFTTWETVNALEHRLPPGWTWRQEQAVRIPEFDEPEPDVAIVRGANADYRHRIPVARDVALLVEVSDSTLSQDRGVKCSAYAKARIPVYWVVNLVDRQVEVFTNPGPTGFASHQLFPAGQQVPVVIDGQQCGSISVDDILP